MAKFRKKPVEIEAWQWENQLQTAWPNWVLEYEDADKNVVTCDSSFAEMYIPTLEGMHTASNGDWIIRGVKGELYPCKPDIFEATYEPVE